MPEKSASPVPGPGFFEEFQDKLQQKDPNTIGILVGLIVVLVSTLLIIIWTRKRSSRRGVLVLGSCEAGKTTLLAQLIHNKPVETYTSMKENTGSFVNGRGTLLHMVDIPGHERVRAALLDKFQASARGIIYVVDSGTVSKQVRDVAEFLFKVLSSPLIHSARPSLLVVANKQDQIMVKNKDAVQALLEKEITNLRQSHSNRLEGTDGEDIDHVFLGREGKDFQFNDLKNKVEFCEASALESDQLAGVRSWLDRLA